MNNIGSQVRSISYMTSGEQHETNPKPSFVVRSIRLQPLLPRRYMVCALFQGNQRLLI